MTAAPLPTAAPAFPAARFDRDPALYTAEDFLPISRRPAAAAMACATATAVYGAADGRCEASAIAGFYSADSALPFCPAPRRVLRAA